MITVYNFVDRQIQDTVYPIDFVVIFRHILPKNSSTITLHCERTCIFCFYSHHRYFRCTMCTWSLYRKTNLWFPVERGRNATYIARCWIFSSCSFDAAFRFWGDIAIPAALLDETMIPTVQSTPPWHATHVVLASDKAINHCWLSWQRFYSVLYTVVLIGIYLHSWAYMVTSQIGPLFWKIFFWLIIDRAHIQFY